MAEHLQICVVDGLMDRQKMSMEIAGPLYWMGQGVMSAIADVVHGKVGVHTQLDSSSYEVYQLEESGEVIEQTAVFYHSRPNQDTVFRGLMLVGLARGADPSISTPVVDYGTATACSLKEGCDQARARLLAKPSGPYPGEVVTPAQVLDAVAAVLTLLNPAAWAVKVADLAEANESGVGILLIARPGPETGELDPTTRELYWLELSVWLPPRD